MSQATLRFPAVSEEPQSAADPDNTVAIVIPAHNEEGAIGGVLAALQAELPANVIEVLVVDDGSSDRTAQVAESAGARVIRHTSNRGYGAALKTGIRAARASFVLTMDADGQHRIEDVARLCELALVPSAPDCVIGKRTQLFHSPLWRMPGKWMLTHLAQLLTQKKIPDLNSGLRLMRRTTALRYIQLCPQGFSFSTTITMAFLSRGCGVEFVPIEVNRRIGTSSVNVRTGFQTLLLVLRLATLFNPLRLFLPLAGLLIFAGIGWTIPYLLDGRGVTTLSMTLITTGVLMFALGLVTDQVAQMRLERYE